ncbi:hypothetical protein [uncultured Roseobacter sp.]|uniref:hypothetical protein n=1 Tax=uncultured Roseobacter sp. TaxID=114847 RepID=UPI0026231372|nr:hypothetical protein [uncultured Roseobacter sp.]
MNAADFLEKSISWLNSNQGVLTLAIFVVTLVLGWVSGVFAALRRKPHFRVSLIDGPTFACTFHTGEKHKNYDVHKTGIALYVKVANTGTAPSSISGVSIAYRWQIRPLSVQWLKYGIGWFWLERQAVALTDFQAKIGSSTKVFPFLSQRNSLSPSKADTYLREGQETNGVVYFEQSDSWGGCFPRQTNGQVIIKVRLTDVTGRAFTSRHTIPAVDLDEARKYNPRFGETLLELHSADLVSNESASS